MTRSIFRAVALCLALAATAGVSVASPAEEALERWSRVLTRFVNDAGQVDFAGLDEAREDLDAYVRYVGEVSPLDHPGQFPTPESRLAYFINSYNALSMHGVLEADQPRSLGGLNKYWFFGMVSHEVGGRSLTLHRYETDHIRTLGDPRVHFALNCMSIGCPRLPREPFTAERLEEQLEAETRRFLAEPRNLEVDHERETLRLSEIFDFFTEDFLAVSPSLHAYVSRYLDQPVPESYALEFIDYDWTVNRQPGR